MNHTAMNNSIWTTNSQSLSDFEFSHFCRYFPFLFDSCGHILLIVKMSDKHQSDNKPGVPAVQDEF